MKEMARGRECEQSRRREGREREREERERDGERIRTRGKRRRSEASSWAEGGERVEDEELMEKRRRKVQAWTNARRKKAEEEGKQTLGESEAKDDLPARKSRTLQGESGAGSSARAGEDMDVDEDLNPNAIDGDSMAAAAAVPKEVQGCNNDEEEEIDPLDAFMNSAVLPQVEKQLQSSKIMVKYDEINVAQTENCRKSVKKATGRIIQGEDSDSDYGYDDSEKEVLVLEDEYVDEFMKRVKKSKVDKLAIVDHSNNRPFRKKFYIEVKEISRMTSEEVLVYRKQLELKIHGKNVPKAIKTWSQTGLTSKILAAIKKVNFEKPTPIQAQALPVIMSGRDCIGIAKTGSGKTLAFVLPMLRHIKDQPPVEPGEGPIGLIMAPTRELVMQIHCDVKKFCKPLGMNCVPVYGGSGVAQQIGELKRGPEIVVCTPGRMIDILCTSGGKITNLRRVSFLVMDEADRMFDMGFEPQIATIVQNIRPDRQTVLFSATFPRQVEILARKVLNKPVEIQVGGNSVVNKDITQWVEVRPESERFLRLLEILGEWYEKGKVLVFVNTQAKCDSLFRDLISHGYPCLSLHGGKEPTDRESTVSDFRSSVCNLMIATSIAARGLDVKDLELVLNFDVPNHYEDYVHRVGRTGRAGRKGCAITFISQEEERFAPDLVKALQLSEQGVPADLQALADRFMAKVNQGVAQVHGTGYGGSGYKFNQEEDDTIKAAKRAQAREYGFEEDKSDSDSEEEEKEEEIVLKADGDLSQVTTVALSGAAKASVPVPHVVPSPSPIAGANLHTDAAARALAAAANIQQSLARLQAEITPEHYEAELEINDFPQNVRWKMTHKETLGPISEWTGAAITTRGQYLPQGKIPGQGERKLYLFIEGSTELSVKRAKEELTLVLKDFKASAVNLHGASQLGKYSVI